MTVTAPAVYYAATYTDAPALLNTTHAAARTALAALSLCPLARTWPQLHLTGPEQLRDRTAREHVYTTRDHRPADSSCGCQPVDHRAAATLADEWLHLWKVALAHITHPDVYDAGLVRRTAQLVTDLAAYLTTGNLDHLIAPQPLSPWFQPPATT